MATKTGKCGQFIKNNTLMLLNIFGIILGLVLGFGLREVDLSKDALMWIGLPGELFLRMLYMLILPLIVCSVISGSASMDPKSNGKISIVALTWIVGTHIIACTIGVVLTILIKPGVGNEDHEGEDRENLIQTQDIFADLFRNLFPNNMVEASFKQAQTQYNKVTEEFIRNGTNGTYTETVVTINKSNGSTGGINVLGLITISTVFGVAISKVKKKAAVFLQFFVGATELILVILRKFFWAGPIGIASLITVSIAPVEDMVGVFSRLGLFVVAVVVGLVIHQFIVLPALFFVITRRNPFKFMLTTIRALLLGFASTSTAVAIPEMLVACDVNKIDQRVSRFVIPFSVTLNADGSVVYITCAAVFITQLTYGVVSPTQAVVIIILTTVCGSAIPSVPSSSIVTLVIVLTSLNVLITQVALLFAVEWILDRIRTQTNVVSHTMNAAITYRICRNSLKSEDVQTDAEMDNTPNGETVIPQEEDHVSKL